MPQTRPKAASVPVDETYDVMLSRQHEHLDTRYPGGVYFRVNAEMAVVFEDAGVLQDRRPVDPASPVPVRLARPGEIDEPKGQPYRLMKDGAIGVSLAKRNKDDSRLQRKIARMRELKID